MNYVGEEKLRAWYREVAKAPRLSAAALLEEVHRHFVETKEEAFVLPPEMTFPARRNAIPSAAKGSAPAARTRSLCIFD